MAADTITREEQVDRYVALDALETFMRRIMHPEPGASCTDNVLPRQTYREVLDELEGPTDVVEEADRLLSVLWPDDDDRDGHEYSDAVQRSDLLAAKLFVLAAGRADAFAAEAAGLISDMSRQHA